MKNDPIVAESRSYGEQLARECNYDVHQFVERLRESERQRKWVVDKNHKIKKTKTGGKKIVLDENFD